MQAKKRIHLYYTCIYRKKQETDPYAFKQKKYRKAIAHSGRLVYSEWVFFSRTKERNDVSMTRKTRANFLLLLTAIIWGCAFVAQDVAADVL